MTVEQIYPNNIHVWYIHVYSPERSAVHDFGYQVGETKHVGFSLNLIYNTRITSKILEIPIVRIGVSERNPSFKPSKKEMFWGLIHTDPHQVALDVQG